jgi:ribosomal protein L23
MVWTERFVISLFKRNKMVIVVFPSERAPKTNIREKLSKMYKVIPNVISVLFQNPFWWWQTSGIGIDGVYKGN